MADMTGGTPPIGTSPFRPPEDFKAVYDHFGDAEMFAVDSVARLPSSDNWDGRQITTRDTGVTYVWLTGDGWIPVGAQQRLGGALVGTAPPANARIVRQAGSTVATVNTAGDGMNVAFPIPFPHGISSVIAVSGDASLAGFVRGMVNITRTSAGVKWEGITASGARRANWIAEGW